MGKLAVKYAPQLADLKSLGESRETIQKNYHLEFSSETRQLQEAEKPNNSVEKQTNSELLRNLAWEKAKDKNHLDAIKYYEAALQQDANNGKTWHGYAWSLSELKRYDEASNAYLIAIDKLGNQHEKGTDESWRYLGWNFQRQNILPQAKFCYEKAVDLNPSNKKAFYALANIQKTTLLPLQ